MALTVFDSLEFDIADCYNPHIINVSGTTYAAVYTGIGDSVFLCTFTISAGGDIGSTVIDSFDFVATPIDGKSNPRIINVSGSTYAVVYESAGSDEFNPLIKISTIDIDASGNIGVAVIDTFSTEVVASDFDHPSIVHLSGDYFAVAGAYSGEGRIFTITIDAAGNIGVAEVDTAVIDDEESVQECEIIHISGTVYAIVYSDSGHLACYARTFTISNVGVITPAPIDTLDVGSLGVCYNPRIIQVSGAVYAVVFEGPTNPARDGFVYTITINADGTIDDAVIGSLEFDPVECSSPSIVNVGSDLFAVAYSGVDDDGFLKTFEITTGGNIGAVIDTLEFDTANGTSPNLIKVNSSVLAVAYTGVDYDGWVKTISTVTPPAVTTTSATTTYPVSNLTGEVTAINDSSITSRGFVFDTATHSAPGNVAPSSSGYPIYMQEDGAFSTGVFSHAVSGLTASTTYYYRAWAVNNLGNYGYGGELSFVASGPMAPGNIAVIGTELHYIGYDGNEYAMQGTLVP